MPLYQLSTTGTVRLQYVQSCSCSLCGKIVISPTVCVYTAAVCMLVYNFGVSVSEPPPCAVCGNCIGMHVHIHVGRMCLFVHSLHKVQM